MNKIRYMMIAAAGTLFSLNAMPAFADDNTDNTNEESTEISVHVAEKLDEMQGIKLSPETFKNYITNGQPMDDPNKIFLLYNVGQKKFLNIGGYWGTHATLKDVPHLFWLQRRNDIQEKHTCYLRYPLTKDTTTGGTTTKNYLSNILSLSTLQVGSTQGDGRSNATYNYVRLVNSDGSSTNLFDEGYAPAGNKFSTSISDFDQNTQSIEAEIDLSTCVEKKIENIISFGNQIDKWGAEDGSYLNLHVYYRISDRQLEIDYVSKEINNGTKIPVSIDPATPLTLKLSKDGLYVNGSIVKELAVTHIPVISYDKNLAGDIVRFAKNSDGSFKIDDNGYYIIDQKNGSGLTGEYYDYLYADESKSENRQTYFISSAFRKSDAKEKEGNYLARTFYDSGASQYGSVGLYADRSVILKYKQEGQWSIDPVEGQKGNVYTFSITFTKGHEYYVLEPDTNATNGYKYTKKVPDANTQMFMQATSEYVKSGNLKDGNNGNYYDDPKGENINTITGVEVLTTTPTELKDNAANAYWKIISMADYYQLLNTESSQMNGEVDLTFMLADPNFEKESARLSQWKKEGELKEGTLKIGMDKYYKTDPNDTIYIKNYNNLDKLNNVLSNHGRALGVMIYNGGRGRLYQDAKVYYPGWYTIQCGGMTNANGKLFVQRVDNGQVSEPVMKTLTKLEDEDIARHNNPKDQGLGWPYDNELPMYNAVLEINDLNLNNGEYVEKYKNSVKIFIREASWTNPVTLRFGVEVAEEANLVPLLEDETNETTDKAVSTKDEITIFDDFHLLFNGKDEQPDLVLSENYTDLNYIENAKHTYDLQPLHLERTFSKGENGNNWNTIILPVALTETQVKEAFGENTKLAKLYALTDKNILFTYEEPNANGVLLRAYTPYIIKPDNAKGTAKKYSVFINLNDGKIEEKTVSENHFDFSAVTLAGKKLRDGSSSEYHYPISMDYPNYVASYATGNDAETLGTMTIYGTLCKTYTTTGGVNTIINGRPTLKGGSCYIMKDNVMYRVPDMEKGYGLKGMRCWFEYTDPATGQAVDLSKLKLNINGIEDDATSISDITANDGIKTIGKFADGIYSLNGERIAGSGDISSLPKGIYIVNGKKFMK